MKIAVVNFSISNAGDFLIERRMNSLMQRLFPYAEFDFINGTKGSECDYGSFDMVCGGGGPYFDDRITDDLFAPFFERFICRGVPVHIVGSGVYGEDSTDKGIYEKKFKDSTLEFYRLIEQGGGTFSCRDHISWRVMRNNGIKNLYLTGCPAWYDFDFIDNVNPRYSGQINKIMISDPGVTKKSDEQEARALQAIEVIKTVSHMFPQSRMVFSFNNGIETKYSHVCNNIIKDFLECTNIEYIDMSGCDEGFKEYDDADLHIGFRVHSHIYSLSRRIPSILIEEDLRGYGMNETFGLPHLLPFDLQEQQEGKYQPNLFLSKHLDDLVQYHMNTDFTLYEGVFRVMKNMYYNNVKKWKQVLENHGIMPNS